MNDDRAFLRAHIPDYAEYTDEATRHDTDMRIRAYVGERLAALQQRLAGKLEPATVQQIEALLLRCQFTDQAFTKHLEHATLNETVVAALLRADRTTIELADRLPDVTAAEAPALIESLDAQFDRRSVPLEHVDPRPATLEVEAST